MQHHYPFNQVPPVPPQPVTVSGPSAFATSPANVSIRQFLTQIARHKFMIFAIIVCITGAAFVALKFVPPRFSASAFVMLDPKQIQIVDVKTVLSGRSTDQEATENEIQVVQSRRMIERVIADQNLLQEPEINPALQPETLLQQAKSYVKSLLPGVFGDDKLVVLPITEDEASQRIMSNTIDEILKRLSISPEGRSRVLRLTYESEDPRLAARIVNSLADFYIVSQLDAKFEATVRANDWLNDRLSLLREQVRVSEQAVEDYRRNSGLTQGRSVALVTEQISTLGERIIDARSDLAKNEARQAQVNALLKGSDNQIAGFSDVINSPTIQQLRQEETLARKALAAAQRDLGTRHPEIMRLRTVTDELSTRISSEVGKIASAVRDETAISRSRVNTLEIAMNGLKAEVAELNNSEIRLRELEREADANRQLFDRFLSRFKETSAENNMLQPDAQILSKADIPQLASFPNKPVVLALAMASSIILAIMLVLAIEMFRYGYFSSEQIESELHLPVVAMLPELRRAPLFGTSPQSNILINPNSPYAEAVRTVHAAITIAGGSQKPKCVLITSSLPNEGKTSCALSLARLLALLGRRVLVIDCDLRRPSCHQGFGVKLQPGLIEYLSGRVDLNRAIQKDPGSSAELLPAGRPHGAIPDLFGDSAMEDLLHHLGNRYDLILLDSGPVMAVPETCMLSRHVDQTLFLVRYRRTRRAVVAKALALLHNAGANVPGVIFSMVDQEEHAKHSETGRYFRQVNKYYSRRHTA